MSEDEQPDVPGDLDMLSPAQRALLEGKTLPRVLARRPDGEVYSAGLKLTQPITNGTFTIRDSGQRQQLANGMVRDVTEGKVDWSLVLDGPMFRRWNEHMSKGAAKYGKRNWCKALTSTDAGARAETTERFKESALRHFMQWFYGDRDEDHASAAFFNINGYEAMLETEPK